MIGPVKSLPGPIISDKMIGPAIAQSRGLRWKAQSKLAQSHMREAGPIILSNGLLGANHTPRILGAQKVVNAKVSAENQRPSRDLHPCSRIGPGPV